MVSIDQYLENDRITCNVYGNNDELLIGVGTPINTRLRKRLDERDWHVDKPSEYIYDNIALLNEDLTPIVTDNIDTKLLIEKAKRIVELVLNNPIIFSNLQRIHLFDEYTYEHCNGVACLSVAMGIRMNLDTHDLINLAIASLTHDIGKCLIPKEIINKPGKLTDEEIEQVRLHSTFGHEIMIENKDIDKDVSKIILHHHENYNGTGYPYNLKEDEIPLSSSIIHVCDVFDALISERPYKHKLSEQDSMNIIINDSGKMFNPRIVEVFSSSLQIYSIGSIIELENGEKVEITEIEKDTLGNIKKVHFKEINTDKVFIRKMKNNK